MSWKFCLQIGYGFIIMLSYSIYSAHIMIFDWLWIVNPFNPRFRHQLRWNRQKNQIWRWLRQYRFYEPNETCRCPSTQYSLLSFYNRAWFHLQTTTKVLHMDNPQTRDCPYVSLNRQSPILSLMTIGWGIDLVNASPIGYVFIHLLIFFKDP